MATSFDSASASASAGSGSASSISVPGSLTGHQLAFTMMGYEACEPRFANLAALPPHAASHMPVHGIAHQLPRSLLPELDEREGCVANAAERAFDRIEGAFVPYGRDAGGGASPIGAS